MAEPLNQPLVFPAWSLIVFPVGWTLAFFFYLSSVHPNGFPDEVFQWDDALIVTAAFGSFFGLVLLPLALFFDRLISRAGDSELPASSLDDV